MASGNASTLGYAGSPITSARPALTGRMRPWKPCLRMKRSGRAVFFFSSAEAPTSATTPGVNSTWANARPVAPTPAAISLSTLVMNPSSCE